MMTDWADIDDDDMANEFADISMERLGRGRYAVSASIMIGDKIETRRLECRNPAWATAQLEEQLSELLLAHERAKVEAADRRARAKKRNRDG